MVNFPLPADAFGDRFTFDELPLPRAAEGYAVQMLDTDKVLDRLTGAFLPVRADRLDGLFDSFDAAYAAARTWVETNCLTPDHPWLAIVPAAFDHRLNRHVLIYGVLYGQP